MASHKLGILSEVFNGDVVCPTRMIALLDSQDSDSTTDLSMRVGLRYFHARRTHWTMDASVLDMDSGIVGKC